MFMNRLPSVIAFSIFTPPTSGSHNFFISYMFMRILVPQMCQEEEFDLSMDAIKIKKSSLDFVEL
jgi:hypothetical protein